MQNENLQKALQCAQLLRQDLVDIARYGGTVESALAFALLKQLEPILDALKLAQGGEE